MGNLGKSHCTCEPQQTKMSQVFQHLKLLNLQLLKFTLEKGLDVNCIAGIRVASFTLLLSCAVTYSVSLWANH